MKEAVRERKNEKGNSNLKLAVARCFLQSRNNHRGVDGSADFANILAAIDAAKDGDVELTVIGRFISGQYFHSACTVTIVNPNDDDG